MKKVGSKRIIKLIVQVSPSSIDILRFVSANIRAINRLGYHIVVEKIKANDHGAAAVLRERGITKVPAIIDVDGSVIIGRDSIEKFFHSGIQYDVDSARFAPGVAATDDIHAYMTKGLWDGVDRDGEGRLLTNPNRDRDEDLGDESVDDYDRRIADFERRSKNRHHSNDNDMDDDMHKVSRRRGSTQSGRGRRRPVDDDDEDDQPPRRGGGGGRGSRDTRDTRDTSYTDTPIEAPATGNQLDDEMYKAWVNNMGASDY